MAGTMRAMQVTRPGGPLELVERPIAEPAAGQVRIRVEACGVCHSDMFVKEGLWPGLEYPRIPGHEVVGRIEAVGAGVEAFEVGDRVGVGWHGGHCFVCERCRRGDFVTCENGEVTGISWDGGYAETMVAPQQGLARVPDGLAAADAAPLLCAGITTYNALRHSGARPGDLVAIQGVGGLGHLGIQFASRMGFRTVAVSSGADKEGLARELGADAFVDAAASNPADALAKMGGARVVLATAPDSHAISAMVGGLATGGVLLVVGVAAEPLTVSPLQLVGGRRSVAGWPSGTAMDSEDTMRFARLRGIRPRIETFPLEKANEAYERMISNRARFRVVLEP